ncbi:MAG: CCT domain-containing protein [Actinobacteria bacterium]|nr:CCT domain-containing protein [Actinomycetota bacterium]
MLEIVPVNSEEEDCDEESSKKESATVDKKKEAYWENLRANIPSEFHNIISEMDIPAEYFTALGNITTQPEVKSDRRRRVERYLEKRRLKTWDKKICYNCRQKVAELRLRNKGRFIGRKKIFDLAGLKSRAASELKHEST